MPPGRIIIDQLAQQVTQANLATEILYAFIIIAISLIIYFATKEYYNLSNHKGIQHFRLAFLFFAIAFFFRSFIKLVLASLNMHIFEFAPQFLGILSLLLFMYASSMAIFYLLYSVMYKKWNGDKIWIFHSLAIVIALTTLVIKNSFIILGAHIVLFIFISIITYISYIESKKKRKSHHLHGIYILLFIFWILNILDLLVPNVLTAFQLLIYIISVSVFLTILYKVIKKIR